MKRLDIYISGKKYIKYKISYVITAFLAIAVSIAIFFMLERPGVALTERDASVLSEGIVIIPEDAEAVITGTNGGNNVTWTVYNSDEGYVLYLEPTDSTITTASATQISTYLGDYFSDLTAIKVADGITSFENNFAANCTTLKTVDLSGCTTFRDINGYYTFKGCSSLEYFVIDDDNSLMTLGNYTFQACTALQNFPFEKMKITTWGIGAFYKCTKLENADMSNWTIKTISSNAFYGCTSLTEVKLPSGMITDIGAMAFYGCGFEEFPFDALSEVTTLGDYAFNLCAQLRTADLSSMTKLNALPLSCFRDCTSLTEVNLSNLSEVTSIGMYCFCGCTSLTEINLSNLSEVTTIGINCFNGCTSLKKADLSDMTSLTTISDSAFYQCKSATKIVLPENNVITSIGSNAFRACSSLLDINLETLTNIEKIGSACFYQDSKLECADLRNATKLTEIPSTIFAYCTNLYHVYLPEDNQITSIGASAFQNSGIVTFPFEKLKYLEKLGASSFYGCTNLKTADLTSCEKITEIPNNCFRQCTALTEVTFSDNNMIQTIGDRAFYLCSALSNFSFENLSQLKNIVTMAFQGSRIKSIVLPEENSLTTIGTNAFYNCSGLKKVSFEVFDKVTSFGDSCFGNSSPYATFTEADLSNCVNITAIPYQMFLRCTALKTVKFPENSNITSIGGNAFYQCSSLLEFDGSDLIHLKTIGNGAFYNCTSLKTVDFSSCKELASIGSDTFTNCSNLVSANFKGCESLATVGTIFSGTMTRLKNVDFSGCSSLTELSDNLFSTSPSLERIDLTDCISLNTIGAGAFSGCSILKELTGIDTCISLESIGDNAFLNCAGLESFDITSSITAIGENAFGGCTRLKTISYNSDILTSVGANAFNNAGRKNGVTINISKNVSTVCADTFNSSMNIKAVNFEGVNESLVLGENALKAAGVPLSSMSDGVTAYYVDEYGVVYSVDKTVLYYIPAGIESYEVPESVTTVASNSCAMAEDLVSLSFADISKIETLENNAFANCVTLAAIVSSDTIATTVEEAAALFTNGVIGSNAFYNTGLLNAAAGILTSDTVESKTLIDDDNIEYSLKTYFADRDHGMLVNEQNAGSKRIPDIENPNEDIYYYLTNEIAKMNIILSANSATKNKYCRVYFQCSSEDMVFDFKVGEENSIATDDGKMILCNFNRVSGTNLYYLEFECEPGGTIGLTTSLYYENFKGMNETVKVWSQIVESKEEELKIVPDEYQEAWWYTAIQTWSVAKKGNSTLSYITAVQKNGEVVKRIDKDISYTITGTSTYGNNQDSNDTYGADPVAYITYEDTMNLPDGIYWDEEVINSIKTGNWYYTSAGTVYVNTGSGYITFATVNKAIMDADLIYDEASGKVTFQFIIENAKLRNSTVTNNKWEMDNVSVNLVFNADAIFVVGDDYDLSKSSTIQNAVKQTISYLYAEQNLTEKHTENVFIQTAAVNTQVPVSNGAKLSITKDWSNTGAAGSTGIIINGGEKIYYTITVKNAAAVECGEAMVEDVLQSANKIMPDDMEKMFDEEFGKQLVITIKNGYLQPLSENKVIGTNGEEISLEPIDKGEALETSQKADIITIKWEETGAYLTVTLGDKVYAVGEGQTYVSIEECLNSIGFLNRWETVYESRWFVPESQQTMSPADSRVYMVYATKKTSFEKLLLDKEGDVFEGKTTNEGVIANKAKVYYDDSYTTSVTASASKSMAWTRDYYITKNMKVDGEAISEDEEIKVNVGSLIDFSITMNHYGNSVQESVPLNDKMSGILAAIALVSENEDAYIITDEGEILLKNAGLEHYTDSRGRDFYILSKEGTYKNVKIGTNKYKEEYVADRVIVTKNGAVVNTEIYWYFEKISGACSNMITYQAIVRDDFGDEIAAENYACSNTAYLNERVEDRIYDGISFSGNVITSDKYIVSANAAQDNEELVKYTDITHGALVTYKLSITNVGEKYSKAVKIAYDTLPATYGTFEWSAKNVQIDYVSSTGLRNKTVEKWKITNQSPSGTVDEEKGIYYIYWNDSEDVEDTDSDIILAPDETVDIYVTLQFPDNDDGQMIWDTYEASVMGDGNKIYNTLNVNGDNFFVEHALKATGEAVLQKGVYGIYEKADTSGTNATRNEGIVMSDRNLYTNSGVTDNFITYYVAVYNSGNGRLYLTDMVDVLPEGFAFNNLCQVSDIGNAAASYIKASWRGTTRSTVNTSLMTYAYKEGESDAKDIDNLLCRVTDLNYSDTVEYMSAIVSASTDNGKITFRISQGGGSICYDDEAGMCYLEKGQALVFGYVADIGQDYETDNLAKNTLSMQYYDYNGAGFRKSENVKITGQYLMYPESVNEGSQEILSNLEAENLGLGGAYRSDWFCSNVSVTRGSIVPGAAKSIIKRIEQNGNEADILEGGLCEPNDIQVWNLEFSNQGNKNLTSYTITETIQAPYYFTGDVTFRTYDPVLNMTSSKGGKSSSNSVYTGNTGNVDNDVLIKDISFTDSDGNEISKALSSYNKSEIQVRFKTEITDGSGKEVWRDVSYEAALGEAVTCQYQWFYWEQTISSMTVLFDVDDEGNCVMKIIFDSNETGGKTAVAAYGGTVSLSVQTKKPSGITVYSNFINKVMLTPTEEYEYDSVSSGIIVRNSEGEIEGVEASSMFTVRGAYTTTSWKTVTDNSDAENTADSRNSGNYITLLYNENKSPHYSDFTYTLNVQNRCQSDSINKMIVIDNLPQIDDHMAYASASSRRNSEYMIALKEISDSAITVMNKDDTGTAVLSRGADENILGYEIEFSTETVFDDSDWSGVETEKWLSFEAALEKIETGNIKIEDLRSFRVIVSGGEGIVRNNILTVSVQANIYGEPERGETAWNNFGYKYYIDNNYGTFELSASSLNVGVMTATIPKIRKILETGTGEQLSAENSGISASFIVYKGNQIKYESEQELFAYLKENDIAFTVLEVSGKEIDSQSYIPFEDLYACRAEIGENGIYDIIGTETQWTWQEGDTYTFAEIKFPEHVLFSSMQNVQTNGYTMTYERAGTYNITCKNIYDDYSLVINKTDSDNGEILTGAGFAQYGMITGEPEDETYLRNVASAWSENVDAYIDTVEKIEKYDGERFTLGTVDASRLRSEKEAGYEAFLKIPGVSVEIENLSEIGDDFCQMYTMNNRDGTVTTYYFIGYCVSDENGQISYKGIVEEEFAFLEIAAPSGYTLEHRFYVTKRSAGTGGTQYLNVSNRPAAELPMTGDGGAFRIMLCGMAFMLLSTLAVIVRTQIKKKGGYTS